MLGVRNLRPISWQWRYNTKGGSYYEQRNKTTNYERLWSNCE